MPAIFPGSVVSYGKDQFHNVESLKKSTLASSVSDSDLTLTAVDASTWPSGDFTVKFGDELAYISSRSGNDLTVPSLSERGFDGTTRTSHIATEEIGIVHAGKGKTQEQLEQLAVQQALKGSIAFSPVFTGGPFEVDASGNVVATAYTGDGSGLTGIASGTGGVTNTGSTTIGADTDADGTGVIALQTRGTTRVTIENQSDGVTFSLQSLTQNYRMRAAAGALGWAGLSSGNETLVRYLTADGDGTDNCYLEMIGVGTTAGLTNNERMTLGYNVTGTKYEVRTQAGGTGTVRPLHLYTGANTNQLVLETTGSIGIGTSTPDNKLHVFKGSAGTIASNADAVITLEGSTQTHLQFLTPNVNNQRILFGDPESATVGQIGYFHGTDEMKFHVGGLDRVIINSSGNLGLGQTTFGTSAAKVLAIANGTAPTTSPADAVQLYSADFRGVAGRSSLFVRDENGNTFTLGGEAGAANIVVTNNTTDATSKTGKLAVQHYTNVEQELALIFGTSASGSSTVNVGGGTSLLNSATQVSLYTAANNTTTTGTEVLRIDSAQRVYYRTGSVALGGGSSATLGTIGGSGPTAAGQSKWLEVKIAGTTHWIPAWV